MRGWTEQYLWLWMGGFYGPKHFGQPSTGAFVSYLVGVGHLNER